MRRYARPHWRGFLLLITTMLTNVAFELAKPWPVKLVVDNVLGGKPTPHLVGSLLPGASGPHGLVAWAAIGTVAIFVLGTASSTFSTYLSLRLGQRMTLELAADLFAHLQRLSLRFHSRSSLGDNLARVTGDTFCMSNLVNDALVPCFQALAMLAAMFVVMWSLEPTLTLVALGVLPFLVIAMRFFAAPMKERSRAERDLEGEMMAAAEQALGAVPAVQAFAREETEERRFRSYAGRTWRAYLRSTVTGIWFEFAVGAITTLGTAGIIFLGAELALEGKLTAGTIIVFLSYLTSLYDPLDAMTQTATTVQRAAAESDRVGELLEVEPEIADRPHAREAVVSGPVRFKRVTFGYEPSRPVLQSISLHADPGSLIAIVGPTGAGKTTLVNLLVRFYDPWAGRIMIDGVDIRDFRYRSLREQIGLVLQDPFIFPMTVRDNIAYGRPGATMDEIVAAARAANAHEFIARLPEGYETIVGERGATLSGGEKQRLSIARAFLKNAPILVLDEPTSALDARTEGRLLEALERLMRGRLTFVIAHRLSTIRRADQILVLDSGRIVERGRHEELLDQDGLYARLYGQQIEAITLQVPEGAARSQARPASANRRAITVSARRYSAAISSAARLWRS
jgi:ABC-type multidrug transport system fused ATPase/permease subunit